MKTRRGFELGHQGIHTRKARRSNPPLPQDKLGKAVASLRAAPETLPPDWDQAFYPEDEDLTLLF